MNFEKLEMNKKLKTIRNRRFVSIIAVSVIVISLYFNSYLVTANLPPARYIKGVPFVKQKPHYCGPASLAMVLGYWGVNLTQDEIAAEVFDPHAKLTPAYKMVQFAQKLGFFSRGITGSMELIKYCIYLEIPVIVLQKYSLKHPVGHYRVVVGYNDKDRYFEVLDPAVGRKQISYEEFIELWKPGTTFTMTNWTLIVYPKNLNVTVIETTALSTTTETTTKTVTVTQSIIKATTETYTSTYISTVEIERIPDWIYIIISLLSMFIVALLIVLLVRGRTKS